MVQGQREGFDESQMGSNVQLEGAEQRDRLALAEVRDDGTVDGAILYSRVRHEQVVYSDIDTPGTPKNHILFRSTFLNDTDREQQYNLKAERRTVSTCSFSILEGYTTEQCASLELEVPLPKCVLEASTGFRREYTLEQSRDKQVEEELSWSVESNIKVSIIPLSMAARMVDLSRYPACLKQRLNWWFRRITIMEPSKSSPISPVKFA